MGPGGGTVGEFTSRPGFCFFHFVLLFWNQILTCVSVSDSDNARLSLSHTDRYLVVLNLFSSATSCSYVKAVRARRGLPPWLFPPLDELPELSGFPHFLLPELLLDPSLSSLMSLPPHSPRLLSSSSRIPLSEKWCSPSRPGTQNLLSFLNFHYVNI